MPLALAAAMSDAEGVPDCDFAWLAEVACESEETVCATASAYEQSGQQDDYDFQADRFFPATAFALTHKFRAAGWYTPRDQWPAYKRQSDC